MACVRFPLLAFATALAALASLAAAGRSSEAYRAALRQQQAQYEKSIHDLPVFAADTFQDVFQLKMEDDRLTMTSPIKPSPDRLLRRVSATGGTTSAVVVYEQLSRDIPWEKQFTFISRSYPNPDSFQQVQVLWRPQEQEMASTSQTVDGVRQVTLTQADDHVQLSGSANAVGEAAQSVALTEKDFATLRRLHPRETEEWLRPLFRAIQHVDAFPPDAAIAWQALGSDVPAGQAVVSALTSELPSLDSDNYRVRRDAVNRLKKLGGPVSRAIARLDRSKLSPEQSLRLDEVLASFNLISDAEAHALQKDPQYLLDCLYCADATLNHLAVTRLEALTGHASNLDLKLSAEKRAADIEALRGHVSPAPARQPVEQPSDPLLSVPDN